MMFLLLMACTGSADLERVPRATLHLNAGWTQAPWDDPPMNARVLNLQTSLSLPEELAGAGSELRLDGAWWQVQATTNGTAVSATGGIVPIWLPVGPSLRPGQNALSVQLTQPEAGTSSLLNGGSMTSAARSPRGAQLAHPPTLYLQPEVHVSYAELQASPTGLRPRAVTVNAPDGATVRFRAVLDGEIRADLGEATVQGGVAQGDRVSWDGDLWGLGDGALFWLTAELRHDGTLHDRWMGRTGARAVQPAEGGLLIGDTQTVLMGARMVNEEGMDLFQTRMQSFSAAGLNAIEIHGEQLRPDWLAATDELGVPVVVVPRCIGRSGRNRMGFDNQLPQRYLEQDARMRRALATHPSVVLYAVEGPTGGVRLHSDALLSGDVSTGSRLPVSGSEPRVSFDIPSRVLRVQDGNTVENLQATCMPRKCENAWVVEITAYWNRERDRSIQPETQWQLSAHAFEQHLTLGSPGGIVPTPNMRDKAGWTESWRGLSDRLALPKPSGSARGTSVVTVTGLSPGELAWLEAPLLNPVGAVADSTGTATISLWHKGPATLRVGARHTPVTLTPGRWEGFTWVPSPVQVALPAN